MENDFIREKILECLYEQHNSARSLNSQMMGVRELAQAVKKFEAKSKENLVASNLSFLVKNNFVEEVAIENQYAKAKFGNAKPTYKYRLTKDGLAYFEHGSKFDRSSIFAGIGDISGNGNYIVIGNNNNISSLSNVNFSEGHKLAEDLRRKVNALGELNDEEKISIQADLETVKNQLSKTIPDAGILSKVKDNIEALANIAAIAPYAISLITWISTNFHI